MSKRNQKSSKRRLDFLPNRQNKYSIRKFTVGTASILIGTLLIFGSHQEVEAAETEEQTQAVDASNEDEAESVDTDAATDSPEVDASAPTEPSLEAATDTDENEPDVSKDTTSSFQAPSDEVTTSDQATEQPESEGNVNEETEQPTEATPNDQEEKQAASEASDMHVEDVVQHHEQAVEDVQADSNDQSEPVPSKYEQQEDQPKASVDLSQEDVNPIPKADTHVVVPVTQPVEALEVKAQVETSTVEQADDVFKPKHAVTPAENDDVTNVQTADLNDLSPSEVSAVLKDLANEQEQSKVKAVAPQILSRAVREPNATNGNHRVDTMKRAEVNDFQSFVNALNDKRVQTIVLNQDITARSNTRLKDGVGRYIVVEGNNHTINTGRYFVEALPNSGRFDITFKNANIQTNHDKGLIYFNRSKHDNQELTFENVTHTGHSLVNGKSNVDVNLVGHFTTISNDNHASRSNITAKSIIVSDDAVIKGQRTGLGNVFEVDKYGEFLTGSNANISVDVSPVDAFKHTNGHTAFKLNQGARVIFGNHSNVQITGQNIFSFSDHGRLQTGQGSLIRVTQKGNGNIVDMGRNSAFVVGQRSQFLATSDEHRTPGSNYEENNLIGLDGNSEIIIEESAKLVLDAKNHQWNTKTKSQYGYYNDLVNINAKGQETALLHVKDNATLDLRTDNRNYYAEVISIPLSGNHPDRKFIFDHAYYVNLQKMNIVVSGESVKPVGKKPNLIFMSPKSPGHFQWNGSYIVKMWNPTHLSDPDQHADSDNVWGNVVDLRAEQEGFNTGIPTYNREQSTNLSNQGKALSQLNLNYAQRLVLISNQSEHPEAVNPDNTEHFVEIHDEYNPTYNEAATKPGQPVDLPVVFVEEERASRAATPPEGTVFEIVRDKVPPGWNASVKPNGTLQVIPPADAIPGTTAVIPVKVTFPDGSVDDTKVKVTITPNDAQSNDPGYGDVSTKPGQPVTVPQTGDETLPPGTTFEVPNGSVPTGYTVTVDPNGNVTVTPPVDATPGTSVDIPVKVTYPDGSVDNTKVKVTVIPNDAQSNDPGYGDVSTKPGQPVTVPQVGDTDLPPGTTFEVPEGNIPPGYTVMVEPNGNVTVTPPVDAPPGTSVDIPVKVTYPDGSTEEVPVKVTIDTPDPGNAPDKGETPDNGMTPDPGNAPDKGETPDNGMTPDPGNEPDKGETPDNGMTPDPNKVPDKGETPDNGITPAPGKEPDKGETPDNGMTPDPGKEPDKDETPDNGMTPDPGNEPDKGGTPDDGMTPDPGNEPDKGGTLDDGMTPDPGKGPDKGETPDNGTTPDPRKEPDKGETPDNGMTPGPGKDPDKGETSDNGMTPDPGKEPDKGETPDNDMTPGPGKDPDKGETPDSGMTPNPGSEPDKGETPNNGETPDPNKDPDKGETPDNGMTPNPGKEPDKGETPDNGTNTDPDNEPDKGETPNNGETPDPGSEPDKGETPVNGMTPDPGSEPDKGETPDNGMTPDPGKEPDKGETPDNGMTPDPGKETDKGETPDNGMTPVPDNEPNKGDSSGSEHKPNPEEPKDMKDMPKENMTSGNDGNMNKVNSPNMNTNHDKDGGMTGNQQPVKATDGDHTMHSNMDRHTTTAMEPEMISNDSKQMKSKAHSHSSMQTMTQLPETGESQSHNGALYGGLLAGLGALLLAYKRKKEDES